MKHSTVHILFATAIAIMALLMLGVALMFCLQGRWPLSIFFWLAGFIYAWVAVRAFLLYDYHRKWPRL